MRITILMDNNAPDGLACEWGFSALLETGSKPFRLLLDFGETEAFVQNARKLGVNLADVDACVLSHAHSDHAGGIRAFLAENRRAPIFASAFAAENCWWKNPFDPAANPEYIGIRPGTIANAGNRLVRIRKPTAIAPGIWAIPHTTHGLEALGATQGILVADTQDGGLRMRNDDFSHEIFLVFEQPDGIVIASGCSHAGGETVVREARTAFPGQPVKAIIGGLHLYENAADEVERFARNLLETGVEHVITGHCTGGAIDGLRAALGPDRVSAFESGAVFDI